MRVSISSSCISELLYYHGISNRIFQMVYRINCCCLSSYQRWDMLSNQSVLVLALAVPQPKLISPSVVRRKIPEVFVMIYYDVFIIITYLLVDTLLMQPVPDCSKTNLVIIWTSGGLNTFMHKSQIRVEIFHLKIRFFKIVPAMCTQYAP